MHSTETADAKPATLSLIVPYAADAEIQAMHFIVEAMAPVRDTEAKLRIARWVLARWGMPPMLVAGRPLFEGLDEMLRGCDERVPCGERSGHVHIMLDA